MLKRPIIRAVLPFLLIAGLSACRTSADMQKNSAQMPERDLETVLAGNTLLEAIRTQDYARFQSCLADEKMTGKEFAEACENLRKQFGGIESFRLIALPETPLAGQGVWLVCFKRKNAKGETVRQE